MLFIGMPILFNSGVLILKLKEVTPAKVPQKFSHFWRNDVRAHRDYYKAIRKGECLESWNSDDGGDARKNSEKNGENLLQSIWERAAQDQDLSNIQQWVVMASAASPRVIQENPFK